MESFAHGNGWQTVVCTYLVSMWRPVNVQSDTAQRMLDEIYHNENLSIVVIYISPVTVMLMGTELLHRLPPAVSQRNPPHFRVYTVRRVAAGKGLIGRRINIDIIVQREACSCDGY